MSRTKTNSRHPSNERRLPAWLWLLTGMVLGAFIMFLLRLNEMRIHSPSETKEQTDNTANTAQDSESSKPIFSFYDDFKKEQVHIPEYETPQQSNETATHQFFLQVASFRRKDDADALRAQLIISNIDAQIEKSKLSSGTTAYRVIAGPYPNKSRLAKARQALVTNGHDPLTLKREI